LITALRTAVETGLAYTSGSDDYDESVIHALYQQLMNGWNRGSGKAFAAPFASNNRLFIGDDLLDLFSINFLSICSGQTWEDRSLR
jgi:hypothetical protein